MKTINLNMEDPGLRSKYESAIIKMSNKADVSYFKYGPVQKNFAEGRVDAVGSAELNIEKFKRTKNVDYLLDAANYLIYRYLFMLPGDNNTVTDSDQSAGTVGTPINMED